MISGGAAPPPLDAPANDSWEHTPTSAIRKPFTNLSEADYKESPTGNAQHRHDLDLIVMKAILTLSGDQKTDGKLKFLKDYLSTWLPPPPTHNQHTHFSISP